MIAGFVRLEIAFQQRFENIFARLRLNPLDPRGQLGMNDARGRKGRFLFFCSLSESNHIFD